ncbi:MAG: SEC-C domain-containing protein [Clostridia bacterium]|nr:SEC-C domain-containing protein [Clostridia bacterium]
MNKIIEQFHSALLTENLSYDTVRKHIEKILDYYDDFILVKHYELPGKPEYILEYFNEWVPTQFLFSSQNYVKESITSIRKFYKYLASVNIVDLNFSKEVNNITRENKESWLSFDYNQKDFYDHLLNDFLDMDLLLNKKSNFMQMSPSSMNKDLMKEINFYQEKEYWKSIDENQLFLIEHKNKSYFANIMGYADEYTGIMIYEGLRGLRHFLYFKEVNPIHPYEFQYLKYGFDCDLDFDVYPVPIITYYDENGNAIALQEDQIDSLTHLMIKLNQTLKNVQLPLISNDILIHDQNKISSVETILTHMTSDKKHDIFNDLERYQINKMQQTHEVWTFAMSRSMVDHELHNTITLLIDHTVVDYIISSNNENDQKTFIINLLKKYNRPKAIVIESLPDYDYLDQMFTSIDIPVSRETTQEILEFKYNYYSFLESKSLHRHPLQSIFNKNIIEILNEFSEEDFHLLLEKWSIQLNENFNALTLEIIKVFIDPNALFDKIITLYDDEMSWFIQLIENESLIVNEDVLNELEYLLQRYIILAKKEGDEYLIWITDEVKNSFSKISSDILEDIRDGYFSILRGVEASINLYGVISYEDLKKVLIEVYEDSYFNITENFDNITKFFPLYEERDLCYIQNNVLYHPAFLENIEVANEFLKSNKTYFTTDYEEFIKYANDDYFGNHETFQKYLEYLYSNGLYKEEETSAMFILKAFADQGNIDILIESLEEIGYRIYSELDLEKLMAVMIPASKHIRIWGNRGYTLSERSMTEKRDSPKIGRNDPCPCGSGKKYKKCCGK